MTLGPLEKLSSALQWKGKLVEGANLSERTGLKAGACLAALLGDPAGAKLASLEIYTLAPDPVVKALAKAPSTLRTLRFFSPTKVASLRGLGPVLSRLKRLVLDGKFELSEPLLLPDADEVAIEIDALSEASARCVAEGRYPARAGLDARARGDLRHAREARRPVRAGDAGARLPRHHGRRRAR